jgi:CRISPR-associated protein Csm1
MPDTMSTQHPLQDATCRVALAAYLHDLGKFAERAGVFDRDPRLDAHLTLYCPFHAERGYHSHRHAAHTALAFDAIDPFMPPLATGEAAPFATLRRAGDTADSGSQEDTDSLINAAAAHHKPDSFLQWVVATADRVASGFEREEFERYNAGQDETRLGLDHFSARQLTLFEQIRLAGTPPEEKSLRWRYPLAPMAPGSLFPVQASTVEHRDRSAARADYSAVWQWFESALRTIPASHRQQWPLWLDHFDSLWLAATHAIPAATAFNVKPDVSLYDHSHTAAALAAALWRWHHEHGNEGSGAAEAMRTRADFDTPKFLLVQGDFFGIQDFIFAGGGEARRSAVRLLRGRSFQVSTFTELAALRVLDALGLPPTSQVVNAAGKFLIVAPNTPAVQTALQVVRRALDDWFLEHTFGQAGVGIAWEAAASQDFISGVHAGANSRFAQLRDRLTASLERAKHQRFGLCATAFEPFTQARYPHGPCAYNGRLPADRPDTGAAEPASCALSRDQIAIGRALVQRHERMLVIDDTAGVTLRSGGGMEVLELPVFGYRLAFTGAEDASGRFGELAATGALRRCFDYAGPSSEDTQGTKPLWSGYARRFISGHVPLADGSERGSGRYRGLPEDEFPAGGELATFDLLACDDRLPEKGEDGALAWRGIAALGILKGDIDDLGELFRVGLERPSFAKHAALSRQVNAFFAIYTPWLLAREFPNVYTVFAGGDDFFLIGPWRTVQRAAERLRSEFARYVAGNEGIHFSVGIATVKPGAPVQVLATLAEEALSQSKRHGVQGAAGSGAATKNAVTCFGQTVHWRQWPALESAGQRLDALRDQFALSTGYVYGLLQFVNLRQKEQEGEPEAAMWRSRFGYRTRRFVVDRQRGLDDDARRQRYIELAHDIGASGIEALGSAYRIVLFNHLYRHRDR